MPAVSVCRVLRSLGGIGVRLSVDGLRDPKREFYDVALDYLEAMRTSPMADKAFQEVIDYEVGVTLLQASKLVPPAEREQQLDKARGYFQKFLADHFHTPWPPARSGTWRRS